MDSVRERLRRTKIQKLQLDPFGFCNAKCWFCPVKYIPQPEEGSGNMPVSLIDKIFSELSSEKVNGVVDPNFNFFTTAHYNEVLLYKDVEKLFDLARKYKFQTYVLSNGISLNPKNTDLISEYRDVVIHLGLNIPAFQKELWAKRSGFAVDQFDRLMNNIEYAKQKLSYLGRNFQVIVNGITSHQVQNQWVELGPDFKQLGYDLENEHREQLELAEKLFPNQFVYKGDVFDRAGYVENVISNRKWRKELVQNKNVVGCTNFGDRTSDWIHINSSGKVFLCCNDYNFEYEYGDVKTQSLSEIWSSEKRIQVIEKAYKQICTGCISAVLR